jgi:hypothetical protein
MFASGQELCGLSYRGSFHDGPLTQPVVVKQPKPIVKPFATPPVCSQNLIRTAREVKLSKVSRLLTGRRRLRGEGGTYGRAR